MPFVSVLLALVAGFSPATAPARDPLLVASRVLHSWDAARSAAWASGDVRRVRALYVRGSRAGDADAALMRRYADRGLVVRRIETQVLAVTVLHLETRRVRVAVLDRVAGGVLNDGSRLSSSPAQRRVVTLTRVEGRWLVASVSGWGAAPRSAPP